MGEGRGVENPKFDFLRFPIPFGVWSLDRRRKLSSSHSSSDFPSRHLSSSLHAPCFLSDYAPRSNVSETSITFPPFFAQCVAVGKVRNRCSPREGDGRPSIFFLALFKVQYPTSQGAFLSSFKRYRQRLSHLRMRGEGQVGDKELVFKLFVNNFQGIVAESSHFCPPQIMHTVQSKFFLSETFSFTTREFRLKTFIILHRMQPACLEFQAAR